MYNCFWQQLAYTKNKEFNIGDCLSVSNFQLKDYNNKIQINVNGRKTVVTNIKDKIEIRKMNAKIDLNRFIFQEIKEIEQIIDKTAIDICDVIVKIEGVQEVITKKGNKIKLQKAIIVDKTGKVQINFWSTTIEFNKKECVIAIKNGKISRKTTNDSTEIDVGYGSIFEIDEAIEFETKTLENWKLQLQQNNKWEETVSMLKNFTKKRTYESIEKSDYTAAEYKDSIEVRDMLQKWRQKKEELPNKKFIICAKIERFYLENNANNSFYYEAADEEENYAKVEFRKDVGKFYCSKNKKFYSKANLRYQLKLELKDVMSCYGIQCTVWNECMRNIVHMNAEKLLQLKQKFPEKFSDILMEISKKEFECFIRAQEWTYNEKRGVTWTLDKVEEIISSDSNINNV